jgi:hypothetical protein
MTASSLGFFLRGVVMPLERGSCFNSSGTIPAAGFTASRSVAMALNYILHELVLELPHCRQVQQPVRRRLQALQRGGF